MSPTLYIYNLIAVTSVLQVKIPALSELTSVSKTEVTVLRTDLGLSPFQMGGKHAIS